MVDFEYEKRNAASATISVEQDLPDTGVQRQLEVAYEELAVLHDILGGLEDKLVPVLIPEEARGESDEPDRNQPNFPISPLAHQMRNFAEDLSRTRYRLLSIKSRVNL